MVLPVLLFIQNALTPTDVPYKLFFPFLESWMYNFLKASMKQNVLWSKGQPLMYPFKCKTCRKVVILAQGCRKYGICQRLTAWVYALSRKTDLQGLKTRAETCTQAFPCAQPTWFNPQCPTWSPEPNRGDFLAIEPWSKPWTPAGVTRKTNIQENPKIEPSTRGPLQGCFALLVCQVEQSDMYRSKFELNQTWGWV